MNKMTTQTRKMFFLLTLFLWGLHAQAQITLSVTTTESTCQANGTMTINASGGTGPYQYQIESGPSALTLPPAQGSNVFNALPAGSYAIKVSDLGTNGAPFATQSSIVVPGTYVTPSMNPIATSPVCYNTTDGKIVANAAGGTLPYTFELVAPSVSTAGPQSSDTFENLAPGDYTLRLTDGCGNVQTRNVTVTAGGGNVSMGSYFQGFTKVGCDIFKGSVFLAGADANNFKPPYTINYTASNGIGDTTAVITLTSGQGLVTPELFRISGYNTTGSYTITNGCGVTVASYSFTPRSEIDVTGINVDCKAAYQVELANYKSTQFNLPMFFKSPVTYVLTNTDTNVDVATQTDNPVFKDFPTGNYKVVLTDACGTIQQANFKWETIGPPLAYFGRRLDPCLDSTAVITIGLANSLLTGARILSGPATAHSTKPGYEYTKSYTYPIDLTPNTGDGNGPSIVSANYAPGDYVIEVSGTCGPPITQTVTVLPSELTDFSYSFSYIQGCTNANKLRFKANQNNGISNVGQTYSITNSSNVVVGSRVGAYIVDDTYNNLPSDTYTVSFHTEQVWPSVLSCDVVHQATLVIPPYSQPEIKLIIQALCGSTSYAIVQPDSLKGAFPYSYAIRNQGALTYGAFQTSPEFAISTNGIYDIQMVDACGNSVSRSVSLGTVTLPSPTKTGTGCIGSTDTKLTMPSNSYYSYSWKRPNGQIVTGNELPINPVTTADFGTYEITTTSTLTGCTSTATTNVTFGSNCALPVNLISFSAQKAEKNVLLRWTTAMEESMKGYDIERSVNARVFNTIGSVSATNVKQQKDWSFTDKSVTSPQTYYYRLKMINTDETFVYSSIKSVTLGEPDETLQLFSNPIGGALTNLKLPRSMENETLSISIFSADGRSIRNETVKANGSVLKLDMLSTLNAGTYLIQVQNLSGVSNTVRFLVP